MTIELVAIALLASGAAVALLSRCAICDPGGCHQPDRVEIVGAWTDEDAAMVAALDRLAHIERITWNVVRPTRAITW